ncbi:MAG: glutamyl-tRNA reductase [Oscillospiraceae bacterium]|nr:glutamyl-tRNA reductase [Oscillospiraceae bacterium]
MGIRMLGIDHTRASVDVRAVFAFTKKNAVLAMEQLKKEAGVEGCIILSTCNRMELWLSVEDKWDGSLIELLCGIKGVDVELYREYFDLRDGDDAISHLFHLTCGLKSQILAEDQIISQVREAHALAREYYCTDGILEVLFRKAVTAAKRVKTEVVFSRASETAMDKAVAMLKNQGHDLNGMKCMVIGNGEMGKLAAQTLNRNGADVTVTVRQYRSGIVQIPQGCRRIDYGDRMSLLPECSIVVSATASPNYTLRADQLEAAGISSPITLIDLAVPRDIDPEVRKIANISLYDIDDFKSSEDDRNSVAYALADSILHEEIDEFYTWLRGRMFIPRIRAIQNDAAADLDLRLQKTVNRLSIPEEEREALMQSINAAAEKVVGKLIFGLRDFLEEDAFEQCIGGLEELYVRED